MKPGLRFVGVWTQVTKSKGGVAANKKQDPAVTIRQVLDTHHDKRIRWKPSRKDQLDMKRVGKKSHVTKSPESIESTNKQRFHLGHRRKNRHEKATGEGEKANRAKKREGQERFWSP